MKHIEQLIEEARRECLLLTERASNNDPTLNGAEFLGHLEICPLDDCH
jgi:hypothetical protein